MFSTEQLLSHGQIGGDRKPVSVRSPFEHLWYLTLHFTVHTTSPPTELLWSKHPTALLLYLSECIVSEECNYMAASGGFSSSQRLVLTLKLLHSSSY